jgi:hypothetical protein
LPNAKIAEALGDLDSDDAVYILEDLDEADQREILAALPFTERVRLRRSLDYPEDTAGRRMQTEFVAVPPFWTVGQTIDYMRDEEDLPDISARSLSSTRPSSWLARLIWTDPAHQASGPHRGCDGRDALPHRCGNGPGRGRAAVRTV